jgi:branched-chain amino acid transport system ATP-binding protein
MTLLEIKELHAGYNGLKVLKGIDMYMIPKEIVALIGPNGAGKSTVIKAIFSIANQYSGKIIFNRKNISGLKTHELLHAGISYVPQGRIVFGTLSVQENLEVGCSQINNKTVIQKRLNYVYTKFPVLLEKKDDFAYTLSGGQQQMLAIGRALMQKPKLLLMDEPSLGLSPKLQKEMFEIIKKLREDNISILIVEQNAKKAIELADRTYLLEDGIVALTGGKEILQNEKIRKIYLGGK